jgi:predicted regulator of Ras-like GTPase activity (Roadblock/LC7/MglB family)
MSLMNAWPQAVRLEIAQMNLIDAKVVVPMSVLERGLRLGKVEFPWKLVRALIRPGVHSQVTTNDAIHLELPLAVMAPLFVARSKPVAKGQRRVTLDETIPNLFFGFPQSDAASGLGAHATPVAAPAAAQPSDTNFYVWGDADDRPRLDTADNHPLTNTEFMKRYATPNEIVARAVSLDGVAGALVALPDGLAVSSRVPPTFNADTLAAFLPQIFAKVSSCTKELRMGSLNNLNFTVGNVPWKIFRVNNVFFAAFGRAEEPLPTAQLAALAAELDRKANPSF